MGTSVGSIQLDLEVKTDLDDNIKDSTDKIAKKIKDEIGSMSTDMFKDLRTSLNSSLNKMTETVKSCLNRTKEEMRAFVSDMEMMLKQSRNIQMPFERPTSANDPESTNTKSTPVRGPPGLTIRKPKIKFDPQFDTEMFKQKYYELESMMDTYDNQVLEKQNQRRKLLAQPVPKAGSESESLLNKQIQDLDIQISKLQDAAARTNISLSAMDRQMSASGNSVQGMTNRIKEAIGNIGGLKGKLASVSFSALSKGAELAKSGIKRASSAISSFATNASKAGLKKLGDGFKNAGKQALNFASRMLHVGKSSGSASGQMGRSHMGLKQMVKTFFVFSLIFPLVSKAIMAMGTNLMATIKTNDQFTSSLNAIRSNLATAFTPIIQAIMPALNSLMSALANITAHMAAFISLLFGKTYSASQQATQGIYNAKEAMGAYGDSAASAAKDVAKANKQLLSFDEITKIEDPNESSGGSGGAPVYAPTQIDTAGISSTVDKIKGLFKNGKFEEIGKIIGNSINKGVDKITSFISWNNVGTQVSQFVDGFTRIFNSVVSTVNWFNIGKMFGTGVNTLVNTLYMLFTGIDWKRLGSALGDGLNGIVKTIDWPKLGATIGSFFQGLLNGLTGFITTTDWPALGSSLANGLMNAINSINWGQLGKTLSDGVLGLISAIRNSIVNINWTQLGNDISAFLLSIDWWGVITGVIDVICRAIVGLSTTVLTAAYNIASALWDGLCAGITEFFADPGAFIKKNITDPFMNWIRSLFGIHSPSMVMYDIGGYLIKGLTNGIGSLIPNLLSSIGTWLGELPGKFMGYASKAITGFCDGVRSINVLSVVQGVVGSATSWLSGLWESASVWGSDMMSGLASGIKGATKWVSNAVSSVADKISSWLHFSRPDVGPLHYYEEWMPDFMKGMAKGIETNTPGLISKIKNLAESMNVSMQQLSEPTIAFAGEKQLDINHFIHDETQDKSTSLDDIVNELRDLKEEMKNVKQSIKEKDNDVYLDGDKITKKVVDDVNKDTRKNGKCPIDM